MRTATKLLPFALLAIPAAAQSPQSARYDDHQRYARAIAAGYKAYNLCDGLFTAGRSERQVEALELRGIYPEYDALVPTLAARIDRAGRTVSVAFDPAQPPRHASWAAGAGCTLAPIGAEAIARAPAPGLPRAPEPDPRRWPLGDANIAPRPAPALAGAVARAFEGAYGRGTETLGVVVLRDGQVVAERYRDGFGPYVPNRTWSVAKSITGTLVGMSGVDPLRPATVPEWRRAGDPRARITLDQLLRMSSGLHSDTAGNRTDALYFGGTAVTEQATGWPLSSRPGTHFRYANNDILLAVRALRASLGEARYRALPARLLAPLGMRHTVIESDWQGNYLLSSAVWTTARDLARLGQFWLQDGVWEGRRLLPAGWMRYMTTPRLPQPERDEGYGASIWLFGARQGLPAGSYSAQGNRGQYVMVVPSERLVVVRRGEDPTGARFDVARFTADVIAAR
ncbi:serine hydrolase [Sphingomonas sp. BK345]|uniref:serine hydrolase domain-containing protein n=1 Tax=Sphingomonas sp. BK345 TaxID=2586980 RepID=UPI00161041B1|nr:serine hydrolase [Sphingomonas sp. BK345]MBB3474450.1 CubicO group peptidase (beta-lactamase class C family) [Sphingomonas sp. BK345]